MGKIIGLAGADGKALLPAIILARDKIDVTKTVVEDIAREIERFQTVRQEYILHLKKLYNKTLASLGEDSAAIFKAYQVIAGDDFFFKKAIKMASDEKINISYAVEMEKQKVSKKFAAMDDLYMKERAVDITNVCDELIRRMADNEGEGQLLQKFDQPFLLVADDLTPEDTVRIDKQYLGGFVTEKGGVTSHTVILAKSLGIPAVVGALGIMQAVKAGDIIYISGDEGYCIVNPDQQFELDFIKEKENIQAEKAAFAEMAAKPAISRDGRSVKVCINSGDSDSAKAFDPNLCDGIGLFRTEFLFMGQKDYPDEEMQFLVYKDVVAKGRGKEVVIRTLDIGGDKQLDYMAIEKEANPFLGYRAIRICLDRKDMFLTQLRAILRSSAFGYAKIMFPMIVTLEELLQAKEMVEEAKRQLKSKGIVFDENIQVGIMIETPASVFISDTLAKHADFFSIGTNDLIQYITATDRMNEKVQYLYNPCNISVLRAINTVITNGKNAGIEVAMCGEMASDKRLVPLLFGMGLGEFSVAPSQVGKVKSIIAGLDYSKLKEEKNKVLNLELIDDVVAELSQLADKKG